MLGCGSAYRYVLMRIWIHRVINGSEEKLFKYKDNIENIKHFVFFSDLKNSLSFLI